MTFTTLDRLLDRFADYPPDRIRLNPTPGTATLADVLALAEREGKRYELIDGVLVEKAMGFKEAYLAAWLIEQLGPFVRRHDLGIVVGADGVTEISPGQVRIPDVAFYSWLRFPGRRIPDQPIPELVPDLAVDVHSRSNSVQEMQSKRCDYFSAGVRLVWLVDPRAKTVEVFTAADDGLILNVGDTLTGGELLPGFSVAIEELFAI